MNRRRVRVLATLGAAAALLVGGQAVAAPSGGNWTTAGGDRTNSRFASTETKISAATVGNLKAKWTFTTEGDVSATPAVEGGRVYFPDWKGNLYAVDRQTGVKVWSKKIADYTSIPGDKARATPAISDGILVIGNQGPFGGGGAVMGINKDTGALLWKTQVDNHFAAIITQSATIHNGVVYVGVASQEEALSASGTYPCCSFRGSMAALDLHTGAILWRTMMTPAGYPGNAVWGSSPAIDPKRNSVYIATGNNYDAPDATLQCVAANQGNPAAIEACLPADDYFDSILALDLTTGAVKWRTRAIPFDAWTVGCIPGFGDGVNCPEPAGPDYDFGQAPALFTVKDSSGKNVDVVGAGQKSGQYWELNADTGAVRWVTQAGPGGTAGGLQWGSAVDGNRVYTQNANSNLVPWHGSTDGVWSALDARTGQVLWEARPTHGGGTSGPVTTANGVVFGCSLDHEGWMYAMDAATGTFLWSFQSGGSCLSGAAISNGQVFWGSGYSNFGFGSANNKLYAFGL